MRLWLAVSDLLVALGLFGSRPYLWVIVRAANAEGWDDYPMDGWSDTDPWLEKEAGHGPSKE